MSISSTKLSDRRPSNVQSVMHVNPELLEIESELIELKHPDYAFKGAAELTQLFLDDYIFVYKDFVAQYEDIKLSELKRGVKDISLFNNPPKTINSLWKARQFADTIGAKYRKYLFVAFRHLVDRNYTHLPLPNQLYSEHVIEAADKHCNDIDLGFRGTIDPRFLTSNYVGEPVQDEFIQQQLNYIDDRGSLHRKMLLGRFCFAQKTLPQHFISEIYGEDIEAVKAQTSHYSDQFDRTIDVNDFRRSCFGLPYVEDKLSHRCDSCPLMAECHLEREAVLTQVKDKLGSEDPIREKKRLQARERKRKQREREKMLPNPNTPEA